MDLDYISGRDAERNVGFKLDKRRRYFLWDGDVSYEQSITLPCSGCSSDDPCVSQFNGSGCSECGYSGVRRTPFPVAVTKLDKIGEIK